MKTSAVPFPCILPPPLPLSGLPPHLMKGQKDQVQRDPSLLAQSVLDSGEIVLAAAAILTVERLLLGVVLSITWHDTR